MLALTGSHFASLELIFEGAYTFYSLLGGDGGSCITYLRAGYCVDEYCVGYSVTLTGSLYFLLLILLSTFILDYNWIYQLDVLQVSSPISKPYPI